MVTHASDARWSVHGATLVATMLVVAVGCKTSKPPPLPTFPKFPQAPQAAGADNIRYRQTAGEGITPVVINDDPQPSQAQASASQAGGRSTLNGDPNGITRETLNRSIQGSMGLIANCFASITQDPMVAVSFEADPSGRPSLVRVNGAPPDAERCIRNVVQGMRFPSFEGKGVQVDLPLSFHRTARPAKPGSPTGEEQAQEGAPPLFIQP
jgi:hypothetical protein